MSKSATELQRLFDDEVKQFYLHVFLKLNDKYTDVMNTIATLHPSAFNIACTSFHLAHPTQRDRTVYHDLNLFPSPTAEETLTVVLDLDQTLINAIQLGSRFTVYYPNFVLTFIKLLGNIPGIRLVLWTAGITPYALKILEIIDPEIKIKHVISRQSVYTAANWHPDKTIHDTKPDYNGKKNLSWLRCANVLIFDNSVSVSMPTHLKSPVTTSQSSSDNIIKIPDFKATEEGPSDDYTLLAILYYTMYLTDLINTSSKSICTLLNESTTFALSIKRTGFLKKYFEPVDTIATTHLYETYTFDIQFLQTIGIIKQNYIVLSEMAASEAFSLHSPILMSPPTSPNTTASTYEEPAILPIVTMSGFVQDHLLSLDHKPTPTPEPLIASTSSSEMLLLVREHIRKQPIRNWTKFIDLWSTIEPKVNASALFRDTDLDSEIHQKLLEFAKSHFGISAPTAKASPKLGLR